MPSAEPTRKPSRPPLLKLVKITTTTPMLTPCSNNKTTLLMANSEHVI